MHGHYSRRRAALSLYDSPHSRAREADQHHRPGRGLGNRAADGEVETEAARPVSDKIVSEGQVDVGPPKSEPRLMTLSRKKLSATARFLKVKSKISTPCREW